MSSELHDISEALFTGSYDGSEGQEGSLDQTWTDFGIVCGIAERLQALNKRYREALEEIAEHTVVSEGEFPDDNCDWHCTLTMQARAKDALNG